MERLERIKKETEFNHFHFPTTGKFALAFNLKKDDFDWLIEQAEKVEQYQRDKDFDESIMRDYEKAIQDKEEEIQRLETELMMIR
jgi:hypothetical protein